MVIYSISKIEIKYLQCAQNIEHVGRGVFLPLVLAQCKTFSQRLLVNQFNVNV